MPPTRVLFESPIHTDTGLPRNCVLSHIGVTPPINVSSRDPITTTQMHRLRESEGRWSAMRSLRRPDKTRTPTNTLILYSNQPPNRLIGASHKVSIPIDDVSF